MNIGWSEFAEVHELPDGGVGVAVNDVARMLVLDAQLSGSMIWPFLASRRMGSSALPYFCSAVICDATTVYGPVHLHRRREEVAGQGTAHAQDQRT